MCYSRCKINVIQPADKKLTSYYVAFNQEKVKQALYKAIELTIADAKMESETFSSLSTITMQQDNVRDAYICGYTNNNFTVTKINLK
ncbi:MAG: hypothetical protein ACI8R9_001455 [Paraglaciecola sp.]|jgi:hypothetical protein